ncbi:unnamed protein product [Chondrus crispus]|uniref:Radical SAM core domain-containing protein n=1 Tax=Chondrus crispus TaxID=2769 RepID=R7QKM4_CHOCR|nr:unnamed protein product [Chondrus crispus]CDF38328.1 unnamed protein product [Chondrus crispus]|eukprot:XP_005718213.1 unnamed protein product [Chondrus crispus]
MPSAGVPLTPSASLLSTPELTRLASLFLARGVDKIRLTGGEPLLRRDLPELLSALTSLSPSPRVSLTTNGLVLSRMLPALRAAGLSGVNISLDTLHAAKFERIARRKGHARVLAAIQTAAEAGLDAVKVNVVVMKGVNDDELPAFAALTEHMRVDVRFIEYMPFDGNRWSADKLVPYADMLDSVARAYGRLERASDSPNDTSKHYRVPGFLGRVGFITSMSDHFCGTCNRIRVTADGNLKVCLFGREEVSLRDAMREGMADDDLSELIDRALMRKHWMLGGNKDMHVLAKQPNRSMIRIGG